MSGHEIPITWHGHPATAWMPDPVSTRSPDLPADVARATERAAAGVRRVGDRIPQGLEPLARLLLRAEGIASSNIEGLRASVVEVAAAEVDTALAPGTARWVADNLAVVDDALSAARSGRVLTIANLHRWHERLMRTADVPAHFVGAFRDAQSWIGGRGPQDAAYVPPPPEAVDELMHDLVTFSNATDPDPVTQAALAHAQFETIHPYGDGNGRIGRLLVLWVLSRRLAVRVPPPASVLIARDPGGYLAGLHWFRVGETARWVEWFAHVVDAAADASLAWAGEVDEVMAAWRSRVADVRTDAAAHRLLDLLPAHPVVSVEGLVTRFAMKRETARAALQTLEDHKILVRFTAPAKRPGRPRHVWIATELVDLVGGWAG
jgi:Fic family protein